MVTMAQNNNSMLQERNFPSHGHSGIPQGLANSTGKQSLNNTINN